MAWGRERARANQRERVGLGASGTGLAGDTSRVDGSTVSQMCHAFAETGGHGRTPADTTPSEIEYQRTLEETSGHARTRHAQGSGP